MPTTYEPADISVSSILDDVLSFHDRFTPIVDAGVRFDLLMASNDNGNPLKHHGSVAAAMIKIVGPEERARVLARGETDPPDLRIKIDAGRWGRLTDRQRMALLAHELYHVELVTKPNSVILKRDAYDRPVIKLIPDDWTINGFVEVASWYGEDAAERRSYKGVGELLAQKTFGFVEAPEARPVANVEVLGCDARAKADRLKAMAEDEAAVTPDAFDAGPGGQTTHHDPEAEAAAIDDEPDELMERWSPEQKALMDDPNVNEHGVYLHYEGHLIEMPKSWKCGASIETARGNDGRWRAACHYAYPNGAGGGPIMVTDPGHADERSAMTAACYKLYEMFGGRGVPKAAKAVRTFWDGLLAESDPIVQKVEPETPEETAAIDELAADLEGVLKPEREPVRRCNRCNRDRNCEMGVCPYCQSPEFRLAEYFGQDEAERKGFAEKLQADESKPKPKKKPRKLKPAEARP